ncbi:MAG TPA: tetratricopeptide repeat protein [Kiritimatiellia bacterium]|nr:tetratricopeptide repeat protein [Kiritimatiellia bacterium]HMO98967.1 tetratricopeptide repeat protein [Kiritimatiellia bacterium]
MSTNDPKFSRRLAWAVAGAALLFYLINLATYAVPGSWASALLAVRGDNPFRPLAKPLWQLIMTLGSGLPGAGLLLFSHLFSAVCGAVAVWLTFQIGFRLRRASSRLTRDEAEAMERSRWLAGLVAALFVAALQPMVMISTSAQPLAFSLCLLLGATLLTLRFRDAPSTGAWYGFALLMGIGLAEYATFALFAPVFLVFWVWMFWKIRRARWTTLLQGFGLMAIGAVVAFAFCWHYSVSDAAAWREFDGLGRVLQYYLLEQYGQIRYSVPKQGWLIMILAMILPAIYIFWNGHQEADDRFTNAGLYLFRLVLVGVGVITLFNLPGSPGRVMGEGALVIAPFVITALWFGQLAAFFISRLGIRRRLRSRAAPEDRSRPRHIATAMVLIFLGVALVLNVRAVGPRQTQALARWADDLVQGMSGRSWLITQGGSDALIQWRSYALGMPLRIANVSMVQSDAYMRYLESLIEDPGVRSAAGAGFDAMLTTWLLGDAEAASQIAVFAHPDIWAMRGFVVQPRRGVFVGIPADQERPPFSEQDLEANLVLLSRHALTLGEAVRPPAVAESLYRELRRTLSFYANNVGFEADLAGKTDPAERAYLLALDYHRDNLSALHNLSGLYARAERTNDLDAVKARLDAAQARQPLVVNPSAIAAAYGSLNAPALTAMEASGFLAAGLTRLGVSRLEQIAPGAGSAREVRQALQAVEAGNLERAAALIETALAKQPDDVGALRLLFNVRVRQRDLSGAAEVVSRLEQVSADSGEVRMEQAYLYAEQGLFAQAQPLFESLTAHPDMRGPAWVALHQLAERTGQAELRQASIEGLRGLDAYVPGMIILIKDALARNDLEQASLWWREASQLQPGHPELLEQGILLAGRTGDAANLWTRVRVLLNLDPMHPVANYVLAEKHVMDGQLDLAEVALRRALARRVSPDMLNALAWILYLQEKFEEGLPYAEQAVKIDDQQPLILSTYGMLLLRNNQPEAARDVLLKASELTASPLSVIRLHLAEVHAALGDRPAAERALEELVTPPQGWNEFEQQAVNRLEKIGLAVDSTKK